MFPEFLPYLVVFLLVYAFLLETVFRMAVRRKQPTTFWIVIGFFFNPFLAIILLWLIYKKKRPFSYHYPDRYED